MLKTLFGRRRRCEEAAHDLYAALVAQARRIEFYTRLQVADSIDGRFDMVVLNAFLVLRRLGGEDGEAKDLAQALFDLMFADFDQCLREMGVTDMGMSPKIKKMAKAFYGRVAAYEMAFATDGQGLAEALGRNLYRCHETAEGVQEAMAAYMLAQFESLKTQATADLLAGKVAFIDPILPPEAA